MNDNWTYNMAEFAKQEVQPILYSYNVLKVATKDFHPSNKTWRGWFWGSLQGKFIFQLPYKFVVYFHHSMFSSTKLIKMFAIYIIFDVKIRIQTYLQLAIHAF